MTPRSKHTRIRSYLAALVLLVLAGCAAGPGGIGRPDYRAIFTAVLVRSFDASPGNNVCLPPLFGFGALDAGTVDVNLDSDIKTLAAPLGRRVQFEALAGAGLVVGTENTRTVAGKPQRVMTYERTPLGQTFFANNTFCYGRASLDRVVKWKGPAIIGDYQAAFVYYTVKTDAIAPWARSPAIAAAFPTVAAIVNGDKAKERQTVIDLSSDGWDIAEYSKLVHLE